MSARPSPSNLRQRPTGAPVIAETPVALLPALSEFRRCKTGLDVRLVLDALPDHLAAMLAGHVATRPARFDVETTRELVRAVGYAALAREIGPPRARGAIERLFPQ